MLHLEGFHEYIEKIKKDRDPSSGRDISLSIEVSPSQYVDMSRNIPDEISNEEVKKIEECIRKYIYKRSYTKLEIIQSQNGNVLRISPVDETIKTIIFRKFQDDWWLVNFCYTLKDTYERCYVVDSFEGIDECIIKINYQSSQPIIRRTNQY